MTTRTIASFTNPYMISGNHSFKNLSYAPLIRTFTFQGDLTIAEISKIRSKKESIRKYLQVSKRVRVQFDIKSFDFTGIHELFDLFKSLSWSANGGCHIDIIWNCAGQLNEVHFMGKDFQELTNLNFKYIFQS